MINGAFRTPYKYPCQNYMFNDAVAMVEDSGSHYFSCSCRLVHGFSDTVLPKSATFERNHIIEGLMNNICDRCPFKNEEDLK